MSPIDVSKEIRGLTFRSLFQAGLVFASIVVSYGNTTTHINDLKTSVIRLDETIKESKQTTKESQQNNDLQHRLIVNQLREQEVRIVRLETEIDQLKSEKK